MQPKMIKTHLKERHCAIQLEVISIIYRWIQGEKERSQGCAPDIMALIRLQMLQLKKPTNAEHELTVNAHRRPTSSKTSEGTKNISDDSKWFIKPNHWG